MQHLSPHSISGADASAITGQREADLARFNERLLASESATECLSGWIKERHPNGVKDIEARKMPAPPQPPPLPPVAIPYFAENRTAYRHVRLMHQGRVLSEAENWYAPDLLSAEMQEQLANSIIPFGRVIATLLAGRDTLMVDRYWPRPGTDANADAADMKRLPPRLMRHIALLRNAEGRPLSVVSEVYTRNLLR